MSKKRVIRSLLPFFPVLMLVSGCGGKTNDLPAETAEMITINMMHLWPAGLSAQQNKLVGDIIDQYRQEHPHIAIKQEVLENEQYKNKLKILSASNELPDVGITWAAGFMEPYVKGGLFTPLDDIKNGSQLKDKFVAGTTEAFMLNGHTYALPIELNISPIYYNKALFKQYAIKVPETYEDFKRAVRTLEGNGITPIALGNKDRWTGSLWYMYLADRIAGSDTLREAISGTGSFDDPALVQAAGEIQSLVDMNAFNQGFNGLSNDEGKSEFTKGKAAMYLTGTWELPNFTTNPDIPKGFKDNVGFFKFPTVQGGKGDINSWVGGPGVGLFVAESSKVKEEAKAFVEYFVTKWGEDSVTTAGVIPATKVDTSKAVVPMLYAELLNELNNASSITLFADIQMKPHAAQVHLDRIQALFAKAEAPAQFAANHKKAIEQGN